MAPWVPLSEAGLQTVSPHAASPVVLVTFVTYFFFFSNVYLFLRERERERQSTSRGGTEREGDTESKAGSRLHTVSTEPDAGFELTNRETMT